MFPVTTNCLQIGKILYMDLIISTSSNPSHLGCINHHHLLNYTKLQKKLSIEKFKKKLHRAIFYYAKDYLVV